MKGIELAEYFHQDLFSNSLSAKTKDEAIKEMLDMFVQNGYIRNADPVLQMLRQRESLGSTGLGNGIAIPHGKCNAVKELVMAIGIAKDPIDFQSVDGHPVKIILLLVSPADQTGPHIQALARISRVMLDDRFKSKLENSGSVEQAHKLLTEKEAEG